MFRAIVHWPLALFRSMPIFWSVCTVIVEAMMFLASNTKDFLIAHGLEFIKTWDQWHYYLFGGIFALILSMWWGIAKLSKPFLAMRYSATKCLIDIQQSATRTVRYLCIEAENKYGPRAEQTRATLICIDKLVDPGQWETLRDFNVNMRLPWENQHELEYDLDAGIPRRFDLICATADNHLEWPHGVTKQQAVSLLSPKPPQEPGTYRYQVTLGSSNGQSIRRMQIVDWGGTRESLRAY